MGILDKLSEGAEKVAKEAEKVFEQGKTKVEELQLERQMDVTARKLGYYEFDVYRGRSEDPAKKQELLAELQKVEQQIGEMRAAGTSQPGGTDAQVGGEMAEVSRVESAAAAAGTAPNPVSGAGGTRSQSEEASTSPGSGSMGADMAEAQRVSEAAAAAGVAPTGSAGDSAEGGREGDPLV